MSIALIYGGENGTTRGIDSYFRDHGTKIIVNDVEVIRIRAGAKDIKLTNKEIDEIGMFVIVGGDTKKLPLKIREKAKQAGIPVMVYSFQKTLRDNQIPPEEYYFSRRVTKARRAVRKGLIAGLVEMQTTNYNNMKRICNKTNIH